MFLTVKEASELSGKSPTTIYRLCNKRRNSEFIRKEDNKFLINRDFLLATFPQHEKLISHEVEFGKVEISEPVFLEIETKNIESTGITESITENPPFETEHESVTETGYIPDENQHVFQETLDTLKDVFSADKEEKSQSDITENHSQEPLIREETIEFSNQITNEALIDNTLIEKKVVDTQKTDQWENLILLIIYSWALVLLIILFYYKSK